MLVNSSYTHYFLLAKQAHYLANFGEILTI